MMERRYKEYWMQGKLGSWKSIMTLAGSFTFSFLLAEVVHELGHFLAHQLFGTQGIRIHLDPFGGSHIEGVRSLPSWAILPTTAAGPLLNLLIGIGLFLLLRRFRRPILLPLLLWGPVALVQEGVNLSLGLLSPGADARWLVESGLPGILVILAGIVFLGSGILLFCSQLDLAGIDPDLPYLKRALLLLGGISALMLIRAGYSAALSREAALENAVPLGFGLILSLLIAGLQRPLARRSERAAGQSEFRQLTWPPAALSLALGTAAFLFTLAAP